MKFTITSGNPTDEELLALKVAIDHHKMQNLVPVIKRSVFGLPQLRQPLAHQATFGARRNLR
jgi:hypothetical protein